ncbi:dormancy-associated protein-like protein 4 isoform X1 [Senna tora]|uniref:Dormancy-associated protein-like protein 4 isoform X1 n=1 Tax=Senna tora TaxID=362788 RepID=A0A834XI38_9FABA|nr:dormancy-associated protein-like protein 4 isoform X1 [Senna tora]
MATFLHKLWDETLAGPTPDAGLGKLRKFASFDDRVTRSIAVDVRTGSFSDDAPRTRRIPFTPRTPAGDCEKFARRNSSSSPPASERPELGTSSVYYWIMMSALDR